MPIIKSAKKRVVTAKKAAIRNSKVKRTLKESVKAYELSLKTNDKKKITEAYNKAQSALDQAGKKNIIHKNKVARLKSQLAKKAGDIITKEKKTPVKKTVPKKLAVKAAPKKAKTTAKKPVKKSVKK